MNPIITAAAAAAVAVLAYVLLVRKDAPLLHPKEFRDFVLVAKTEITHNTAIYRFKLPRDSVTLGLPIGQHISIATTVDGKEIVRSYTPVSTHLDKGYFELLVKTYPTGIVSSYLAGLKIGDKIKVRGPKGNFTYTPNMCKHLNMVAGGTGITPMFQIINAIISNPQDRTTVDVIFGNVSEEDILLYEELKKIAADHPQIRVHFCLDKPPAQWAGPSGFVTSEMIKKHLQAPDGDSKLLLCGPLPMVSAVKKAAIEVGWPKARAVTKLEDQVFAF